MKFKDSATEQDFYTSFSESLPSKPVNHLDFRIFVILLSLDNYLKIVFGYEITVTALHYYGGSGVHQAWRAADIRNIDMAPHIKMAAFWFLSHFIYSGTKKTVLEHNVGQGDHVHLQVDADGILEISNEVEEIYEPQ